MTRVRWEGIPERYWPDTEKPWRVVSGLGAYADFATKDEAQAHADHLRVTLRGDWADSVQDPFNVVEETL